MGGVASLRHPIPEIRIDMDPTQIRFRAGEPLTFITTRPFALGNTQVTVAKGTEILFDGTKANVDGTEYTLPQLRGAIKAGWLVLAEEYDENAEVARPSANISVRHPTQGGNPMHPKQSMPTSVSEEERVAGSAKQFAHNTREANTGFVRGQTKVNVGQGSQTVMTQRGMMVVESQEGHVVQRAPLKTAAGEKAKNQRTSADMASQVEQQLSKVSITPVAGVSRDELMEQMSEEDRAEYLANIESRKAAYVNEAPIVKQAGDGRKVVGSAKKTGTSTREGITAKTTTGGGIETVDLSGASKPAEVTHGESEGIKFTTTNGPKRDLAPSTHPRQAAAAPVGKRPTVSVDIRRKMAKAACPSFPDNYMFELSAKKKIARLRADYEDQGEILQAVFLAEDDEMKALLIEEFPEAFGG